MRVALPKTTLKAWLTVLTLIVGCESSAKPKPGDAFPNVSLPLLNAPGALEIGKDKGQVVIVDFWATWCAPCKIELPFLNSLAKTTKGLKVIAVNLDDAKADAQAFIKSHPLDIVFAYDGEKKVLAEKLELETMPTSFLLDRQGRISKIHQGFKDADRPTIQKEVEALLAK